MITINYTLLKKALLSFAVAFFGFNTSWAQEPIAILNVNSAFDELHPVIHPTGDLYFTRVFQDGSTSSGDIWKSSLVSEQEFSVPVKVDEFSTESYDLIIGFPDDKTAYVFHQHYEGMQGIFVYQQKDGDWKLDSALNIPGLRSLGPYFNGRLTQNGETIVMSMRSFGSYGNEDLYFSKWDDNTNSWSRAINLGPSINSTYQELTPFFREEDGVLFFSSNRPGDGSGYQLFYSLRLDDSFTQWSMPKSLAFIDSEGITLSFMENTLNENTFFTSTTSSEGYGDIFLLPAEFKAEISNLIAVDQKEKKPLPEVAEIVTPAYEQNTILPDSTLIQAKAEPVDITIEGKRQHWIDQMAVQVKDFSLKKISPHGDILPTEDNAILDAEDGSWILSVPGFIPLTIDWNQPFSAESLIPGEPGSRLDLSIIQFERSSSQLTDSLSIGYIKTLAEFLIASPNIKIGLEGHTDNLGNVELNKILSNQRASQIRDLLVKHGVDFERIRVAGYGGTRPKADNKTEEGRILNRRVELVVLGN